MSYWLYSMHELWNTRGIHVKTTESQPHSNSFCPILAPCPTLGTFAAGIFLMIMGYFLRIKGWQNNRGAKNIWVIPRQLTRQLQRLPPISLVCCLNDFLLMKNEGLPRRFAIKWSPAPPRTRSNFTQKLDFVRLFLRFSIISPKFFDRFCSYMLQCVQDIPTNNFFFLKKKNRQISCVLTISWWKTSKNDNVDVTCKLYLRFSRSRWFRDLLEHFPTSNVKIGGKVCQLYQIHHF